MFFSHAANILRTEVAALEGAQRLAAPVWPESQAGLAALHDLAQQGQTNWTIEAARSVAARQLPAVVERLRVTELVELARLEPAGDTGLADQVRALAAIRAAPWRVQHEKAEALFAAISRRCAELEQAEYARLRESARQVDHARALERVREADGLVREIDAVRPQFADGAGARRLDELRSATIKSRKYWNAKNKRDAVRLLELTICGSLGFWVSVGLLGGWSLVAQRDPCDPNRD